jgi:hypothetical protein
MAGSVAAGHEDGSMNTARLLLVSLLLLVPGALLACGSTGTPARPSGGKKTLAEAGPDATTDDGGQVDAGADTGLSDAGVADAIVPDGQCPAIFPPTCAAGESCRAACNTCWCIPDAATPGTWGCTTLGCPAPGDD